MRIFSKLSATRQAANQMWGNGLPKVGDTLCSFCPPLNSGDDLQSLFHFRVYFVFRSRMYCPFRHANYTLSAVHPKPRSEALVSSGGFATSTLAGGPFSCLGDFRETIRDGLGDTVLCLKSCGLRTS